LTVNLYFVDNEPSSQHVSFSSDAFMINTGREIHYALQTIKLQINYNQHNLCAMQI